MIREHKIMVHNGARTMKKKNTPHTLSLMAFCLCLAACTDTPNATQNTGSNTGVVTTLSDSTIRAQTSAGTPEGDTQNTGADPDDLVENSTFTHTVKIQLSGISATITNPLAAQGVTITQANGQIVVRSTQPEVAYEVTGALNQGSLKIYSDAKFKLTLNNARIISPQGPAINIQSSKTAFVVLAGENSLSDTSNYDNLPGDEDAKGTLFSEGQLVFSGQGSLNVTGNYSHAIVSDDYLRIREGNITVSNAVKDAIHTNDYLIVDSGHLKLSAQSDGIEAEKGHIIINGGTFDINVEDDGIVASYDISEETEPDASIAPYVTLNNGTFNIQTATGEGIESKSVLTINGGVFEIQTADDGINAIESLFINGGQLHVVSATNDALDANGPVTITGGTIIGIGSRGPEAGLDVDNYAIKITGGTLLGLGGSTSRRISEDSTQNALIFSGVNADTLLHIESEAGIEALTYRVPSTVNTILYTSPKLVTGDSYALYSGGTVSNGSEVNGLYTSGTYGGESTLLNSFTLTETLTQIGGQSGPGGGGMMGGGGFFGGPGGRNRLPQN